MQDELAKLQDQSLRKVKVSAGFHSRNFYRPTIAATAFRALGVGCAATSEQLFSRGSNPGKWIRSQLAGHANHYTTTISLMSKAATMCKRTLTVTKPLALEKIRSEE